MNADEDEDADVQGVNAAEEKKDEALCFFRFRLISYICNYSLHHYLSFSVFFKITTLHI